MIANIIYKSSVPLKLNTNLINITSNIGEVDFSLPTLIIGWKFYKEIFPENNTSILNKEVEENLSWTFTRNEKRVDFDKDIINFIKKVFNSLSEKLPYYFIDVLKINNKSFIKLNEFLSSSEEKHIYICNNSFAYIYSNHRVIGLDLEDFNYVEELENFNKIIKSNKYNNIFYNENFIPLEIKKLFYNNKIIIPYLHYLDKRVE